MKKILAYVSLVVAYALIIKGIFFNTGHFNVLSFAIALGLTVFAIICFLPSKNTKTIDFF